MFKKFFWQQKRSGTSAFGKQNNLTFKERLTALRNIPRMFKIDMANQSANDAWKHRTASD